ncbi:unnamed protein product [Symbiodinium sp. CCMP2592]|nr:unnamed protein product [Symbiodinium sp. CCMP2592]
MPPKKRKAFQNDSTITNTVHKVSRKWRPKWPRYQGQPNESSAVKQQLLGVILPEVSAPDVISEFKQVSIAQDELANLLPESVPPCRLKLDERTEEVPLGSASPAWESAPGEKMAVLNAGCYISAAAWAPPVDMAVLALAVNSRAMPSVAAEGPVPGAAAIQLWRIDISSPEKSAQLRLGVVHDAASARGLQWLPSKRTKERLGLLLAALSTGELCLYSLATATFQEKPISHKPLFARFKPFWKARMLPAGAQPASAWQRHVQCAAARESPRDPRSCIVAAGCERSVVLLWRLVSGSPLQESPIEVLRPLLLDAETVMSLAWCPSHEFELLAAGFAAGYIVLWNCQTPSAPLRCFIPLVRTAHVNIDWADRDNLCLPADASCYNFFHGRLVRLRPDRKGDCLSCTGASQAPLGVISLWSDGVVSYRPRPLIRPRSFYGANNDEMVLQSWRVLGADLTDAPFPEPAGPQPSERAEDECRAFREQLFKSYQNNLLNRYRAWETESCELQIKTAKELDKHDKSNMPLTTAKVKELPPQLSLPSLRGAHPNAAPKEYRKRGDVERDRATEYLREQAVEVSRQKEADAARTREAVDFRRWPQGLPKEVAEIGLV